MDESKESQPHNSTYKKLAVQWLNEVQFFNQTFVQVDSQFWTPKSPTSYSCKPFRDGLRYIPEQWLNAMITDV